MKATNKKDKYFSARMANMILSAVILFLVLLTVTLEQGKDIYYVLIFALASIETFIAATVSFAEQKKGRANVYSVIGAIFLVGTVVMGLRFYGILQF